MKLMMFIIKNFNSMKVQLRQRRSAHRWVRLQHFNSIKVQLRHIDSNASTESAELFQFHKGTIKTKILLLLQKHIVHFNSIKVQLRQPCGTPDGRPQTHFNSIKVQLRRSILHRDNCLHPQFQFHKGTIKTFNTSSKYALISISIP